MVWGSRATSLLYPMFLLELVSLSSQFVPVKPFSYLLHAARVAKVEAQRQVIQTHNTYGESFNDCVSPETTVS